MRKISVGIRGTHDFNPAETYFFNSIVQKSRLIFEIFGYKEVILPLIEDASLFRRGVGETTDIVERQMFKIEGKDIVLRPEATAQVVRYYLENSLYKQSSFNKFSYIGPMFRGERPQKGRLRQFHHIGAESLGSNSFYMDAEIILLMLKLLDSVGLKDKELKINSLGCLKDKDSFSRQVKKILALKKSRLCEDCGRRLDKNPLRVLDCSNRDCVRVVDDLELGDNHLCGECGNHFSNLRSLLDDLGVSYSYTPRLVRGLDYYTNTVFEVTSCKLGSQDALGAGGRYNGLVQSLGGPEIAAIGFALGVERLVLALGQSRQEDKGGVFFAVTDESFMPAAVKVLRQLRDKGVSADICYDKKSLKAQLRYAQKQAAKFVVIFGEEEFKDNCVMLKDMEKGEQSKIKIEELVLRCF